MPSPKDKSRSGACPRGLPSAATAARSFGSSVSVELDAIDPRRLRSLVERAIRKHMPKKRYDELMAQEERERQQIRKLVDELDIEEPDEARP